jgi:hypothetical protein
MDMEEEEYGEGPHDSHPMQHGEHAFCQSDMAAAGAGTAYSSAGMAC